MYGKLIIDGNAVYEVDETCLLRQSEEKGGRQSCCRGMGRTPKPSVRMSRETGERG